MMRYIDVTVRGVRLECGVDVSRNDIADWYTTEIKTQDDIQILLETEGIDSEITDAISLELYETW